MGRCFDPRHAGPPSMPARPTPRRVGPSVLVGLSLLAVLGGSGCAVLGPLFPSASAGKVQVQRRSEAERLDRLEREIERLRADLQKAEETLATP